MTESDIDFVVLYCDGSDEKWMERKAKYSPLGKADVSNSRYRNWDNLIFWFRGVEKYAPWVRKIHFVTDHQIPDWLNTNCKKLHCVFHEDYINMGFLPLFNSSAIEIGMHMITDLSNRFVFFNDDMFLTNYITPEYYFKNGLPVDMAGLTRQCRRDEGVFANIMANNYDVLNMHFSKQDIKHNFFKWYKISYGKTFFRTLINSSRKTIDGLVIPHLSCPYLKSDIQRVWDIEKDRLLKTQSHRFRQSADLSHFLFRFWRMLKGDFYPRKSKGIYLQLNNIDSINKACKYIEQHKAPELCLNDCWENEDGFDKAIELLNKSFLGTLNFKSSFEK